MGRPKLSLPFGEELLLQRVVRILQSVVTPVVVVAAQNQDLPSLPEDVVILRDETPSLGPLPAMGMGLAKLASQGVEAAYISACDTPLISTAFISTVIAELGTYELAVPDDGEYFHPLAGVYRTSLAERIQELVANSRLRPWFLMQESRARAIKVDVLRQVDPELDALQNANTTEEYAALLKRAGLET